MGDAPAIRSVNTPFPAPPSVYHSFTSENIARLAKLEAEAGSKSQASPSELAPELCNLRPPTPPANGEYRSFGENRSLIAKLPTIPSETRILSPLQHPSQRTPTPSPRNLLTLTRSLLLSYLELLHILTSNPDASEYGPKWEDLRDLFQNAHNVLNAYRGWQGREALIRMMEMQIHRGMDSVREWEKVEKRAEGVLDGLREHKDEVVEDFPREQSVKIQPWERRLKERTRMWDMLGAI